MESYFNGVGSSCEAEYASSRWHHYVYSHEGGRAGEAGGGGGGTRTDADNRLCKTMTRSKRCHIKGSLTVKGSIGGSIALH